MTLMITQTLSYEEILNDLNEEESFNSMKYENGEIDATRVF